MTDNAPEMGFRHSTPQNEEKRGKSSRSALRNVPERCQGVIRLGCTADDSGYCYSCGRPMRVMRGEISGKKPISAEDAEGPYAQVSIPKAGL